MLVGPRVAFFADSFHEVNGQALTSRELVHYAERYQQPMLSIRFGQEACTYTRDQLTVLELARSRWAFSVERDLSFDPLVMRYLKQVEAAMREHHTELVHITSPGDLGILGAIAAHRLHLPLVISWHTHLHEFGATRLDRMIAGMPDRLRKPLVTWSEKTMEWLVLRFYRLGGGLLAPTAELVEWLGRKTNKPCFLMPRGVDIQLFHPSRRDVSDGIFRLGFVGRLSTEKNVRLLVQVERALEAAGLTNFKFLIVGDGTERPWLVENLHRAEFTGILRGEALARAYANMDAFVFPSKTDSYGNVVAEALASGVPGVVTNQGGPQHQIIPGVTGFIGGSDEDFVRIVQRLVANPALAFGMREASRHAAESRSWDAAFEPVWRVYQALSLTYVPAVPPRALAQGVRP